MTKWGDRPHWEFDTVYLGEDEHGRWLGVRPGTRFARPGMEFEAGNLQVVLAPRDRWWVATFHGAGVRMGWPALDGGAVAIYCDMTTPPRWDGQTVSVVDLDLDVITSVEGIVIVDDEDEFAEHQVELGYPDEVVSAARTSCQEVLDAVRGDLPPFDGVAAELWLGRLAQLPATP